MSLLLDRLTADLPQAAAPTPRMTGQVLRYDGLILECAGFPASPGTICEISTEDGRPVRGEVVGFADGRNLLFLDQPGARITVGATVTRLSGGHDMRIGPEVLGRVLDAEGDPLDTLPAPHSPDLWPLAGRMQNPLARQPVDQALDVGVRILNAALTVGRGQRVGIIAGSGVGKSVLIEMMTHNTDADIVVVGLIGERAREVGAFVGQIMRGKTADKTCVIAVPADRSPLLRLRAAHRATAVAEYFRAQGKQVMLIMDSLTRVAHARREVGLALGEQPTAKGYPPSVVSMIPSLIERAGPGLPGEGSITAFYTILADGDDTTNDPVVDTARAILDGHFVLSRSQAQMGIYPAVDLPQSVSRVMTDIVTPEHNAAATKLRRMISLYMENRDMMLMGAYSPGQDAELDEAVRLWPQILDLIRQGKSEKSDFRSSRSDLLALCGGTL
ncbi:FliI/YscN family ATPase [Pseudoprimorskyibacter insulae]|uniref:Flagellum-specific ATP synthase n=1 Tax=Pseudoprimorskyibacter insulae TaxID=1695997 RepID=A0A2R8AVN3_9RHOB|nr:FliI/YscN family ATPase [Pseudoprimorskyibacter insulae]SPF80083.1 Flagellum-specific ATP synthase [Pseudoprimorskyibacter insulae]